MWTASIVLALATGHTAEVQSPWIENWDTVPDRTWIGADWWANRLQDWQIASGRLQCRESRSRLSMRTAQLLTRSIAAEKGNVMLAVDLIPPGDQWPPGGLAGFLIGGGGSHVDHRLTAQTHHVPAEDGGLLVVVDDAYQVQVRSFAEPMAGQGSQWSISTKVTIDELKELPGTSRFEPTSSAVDLAPSTSARLTVHLEQGILTARAQHAGGVAHWRSNESIDLTFQEGAVALVSHGGQGEPPMGFAFDHLAIDGRGIETHPERAWGPVLNTMYTVDDGVLKLTAQLPPLNSDVQVHADLQVQDGQSMKVVDQTTVDPYSWTATFRVADWDEMQQRSYQVVVHLPHGDGPTQPVSGPIGVIDAAPTDPSFVVAAMNCQKVYTGDLQWNHEGLWLPHLETVQAVTSHDPDLLFFAGDQIYEGDLTPVDMKAPMLDYLYKWYRWCWAFGELTRDTPAVVIPDDHDVYHGNIWGAGGRKAAKTETLSAQDSGGYRMPPAFVNAVHRTQTSHLPDPPDPEPIEQGISVYFTDLDWGGVSCAVLADRMFKSSPSVMVPEGEFRNGWPQSEGFDAATQADVPGAQLLGERQERFLDVWSSRSDDRWASLVLSQTPMCNLATLPPKAKSGAALPRARLGGSGEYLEGYTLASDGDSNGWPQTPRDRAVSMMARAGAIHVCGDQHLGATLEYGVDSFDDGVWAFSVPAVSNTWPRRWFPPVSGANRQPGAPRYTGEFVDGFGNRIRVHAVANPASSGRHPANLHDRMPGYGIIRLNRDHGTATIECWKRPQLGVDEPPSQYPGWPLTFPIRTDRDSTGSMQ